MSVSTEVADVVEVVDKLVADEGAPRPGTEQESVARLRAQLGELGLWTVDGDAVVAAAVVQRLAHTWAALAWASVQAQAALAVLDGAPRWGDLLDQLHSGAVGVAVTPTVDRVDAGAVHPWVIVLEPDRATVLPPEATTFEPLRATGLAGGCTGRVSTHAAGHPIEGADVSAARTILRLGAAAVASGLSEAANNAALRYCGARRQFGAPLTDLATVRDALYLGARTAGLTEVRSLSPAEVKPGHAAALADAACEAAVAATAGAVQLHGGYGYLAEYGMERLLRDAVSLRAACDAAGCRRYAAGLLKG
ncbi:Acyl-CoA dehydrogenase [Frankia sp. Hr75.2]|nr:Acyl-CoA dehydrogenase [Frankia sp. Hr75.2]